MASDGPPLSILFLWHQHQPYYKDPIANRYEMPWVRLHATKDYYDMVAILDEFPNIRLNFNLVPSLLVQLDDYATGKARDRFLDVSRKAAGELTLEERQFILQNFFMAHWENMIDPYPRYRELLEKRGRSAEGEQLTRAVKYFKEQDWLDLQTWFNLAWMDPLWQEKDPLIKKLFEKGKKFTEDEKQALLDKHLQICAQIVAKHKEVQERGQIEITATPFYHPILPLLCDTDAARVAMPHVTLPSSRFSHPEDAQLQIMRALDYHEKAFGRRPSGMWPSEGSVSEQTAELFMEAGVRWVATDEGVLSHSLPAFTREDIYQTYRYHKNGRSLDFFFRDHELSDAIGFVYTSWDPKSAVDDFIARLEGIRQRLNGLDGSQAEPHVVPVILDGENCWEYYRQDGLPFLRELYKRLSEDPRFETVLATPYLDRVKGKTRPLPSLWAGSWIFSNFKIWIGHPEDNRAWDLLKRTRDFLVRHLNENTSLKDSEASTLAWESLYIAEGSDWCWWYGDDHGSANDEMFDYLFRKQLMNVYEVLGIPSPDDLNLPIKVKRLPSQIEPPVDFITPTLDGRVTNYFEWKPAGYYHTDGGGTGTMHRAENLIKTIYFGFDLKNIYLRFDFTRKLEPESLKGITIRLCFSAPEAMDVMVRPDAATTTVKVKLVRTERDTVDLPDGRIDRIIELALPISQVMAKTGPIELFINLEKESQTIEHWPVGRPFTIPYPHQDIFSENWTL